MKKTLYIFIGLILLLPSIVQGAELRLKKAAEFINVGDTFDIILVIDTEGEAINAVEAVLRYSDNLKLENISDGNSIINLWISKPKPGSRNSESGFAAKESRRESEFSLPGKLEDGKNSVFLAGLIPGGIKTAEGVVLNFTFKSMSGGRADIEIEDAKVFANDSEASEAKIKTANLNFEIKNNQTTALQGQKLILDFLPPDEFMIYFSRDKNVFNNSWFISFNAQDKGSGISHYEIRERFLGLFGSWKEGESPYQLSYQSLFDIIEVRAVDNVGRERTERLIPARLYTLWFVAAAVAILFLFRLIIKSHT